MTTIHPNLHFCIHRYASPRTAGFNGTSNPRHLRAISALLHRPITREELDSITGAANGPDLVAQLRRRGLQAPCKRVTFIDRDGKLCRPGVYFLTMRDRMLITAWLREKR